MAPTRHLPKRLNPLLVENTPSYEVLVNRRRLGQTDLAPKAGQVGVTSATKPKNLGTFDYAHLRVPLPKNIVSGIFNSAPPSYFLMRRSRDGFVSATGMFKATFPWAELWEEELERKYIKGLKTTSLDETAGNVWIHPSHALELAEEYQIEIWIEALLDNEPIEVNPSKDATPKTISPPPQFLKSHEILAAPTPTPARARRSASPSKIASPKKPTATPRKSKGSKTGASEAPTSSAERKALKAAERAAEKATHKTKDKTADQPASKANEKSKTSASTEETSSLNESSEIVKVTVDSDVIANSDNTETTHTHVEVQMPAGLPDLPLPDDAEAMIAKAKEMVEAATKADAPAETAKGRNTKRKAEAVEEEDDDDETGAEGTGPVVKKAKMDPKVEAELKREIVKKRALIGISATLAIGALVPYVFGAF
ncbi:MAG: hypothetical protein M1818_006183 [Claussenomyces sp. TS43310]|nr:MAG: hypothetical protein M1818_006183 [Claussenomyces sp. TS43310]